MAICKTCGKNFGVSFGNAVGICPSCKSPPQNEMARCSSCGKEQFEPAQLISGTCPSCRSARSNTIRPPDRSRLETSSKSLLLTTETHVGDVERLGIVATEVVLGMNVFKDALANLRDIFGGRSGAVQKTLGEAREAAFDELRLKAADLGANAVVALDIDYHSLATGSSTNMMIVAVSGTAVRMKAT